MAPDRERYTHGHHRVVVDAHAKRRAADSAQFLLPHLRDGIRLLDFGCGPGSITADLAQHVGENGSIVGIDSSPEAIAIANRDAAAAGVEYRQASVYELPFGDDSFDVAYGHQVLQHLGDPVTALCEIGRVLKPGGIIAIRDADFGSMTHHPHYPALDRWRNLYSRVARSNGGEPDAGRRLPMWAHRAGFVDVVATASAWHYTSTVERRAWARLWADRIQVSHFADQAADLGLSDDIEPVAAAWLGWADEPDGWFAFLHGEVIARKP